MLALVVSNITCYITSNITEALPADETETPSETDGFSGHPLDPDRLHQMGGAPLPPGLTAEEKEVWNQLNATFAQKWNEAAGGGGGGGGGGLKGDFDWLAQRAGAVAKSSPPPVTVTNPSPPPVANSSPPPPPPVNSSAPPPPAVVSGEARRGGEASAAGGGGGGGGAPGGGGGVGGGPN
jgi:hypothetical protein